MLGSVLGSYVFENSYISVDDDDDLITSVLRDSALSWAEQPTAHPIYLRLGP